MGNASEAFLLISKISKDSDILMGTIYIIMGVLSMLGNGILLFVAYRKKSTLKPAEFFVVNLAISDLGMTISLFPLAIPSAFTHMWLFNKTICTGYAFCGVLFGLCSLTNLTVLSSVCWLKVCCPNYGNKFSYCHASMLVAGVWCYAGVFAVGPLSGWGEYGPEPYGTACCINWEAPGRSFAAMSYIICLFFFCYIVPSTVIFLSYTFILMTVRGSRQAVQQHMPPQNKISNAQTLIIKLSVAVCIGFLTAWSPYAIVAMWAAFGDALEVPALLSLGQLSSPSPQLFTTLLFIWSSSPTSAGPFVEMWRCAEAHSVDVSTAPHQRERAVNSITKKNATPHSSLMDYRRTTGPPANTVLALKHSLSDFL
ncbi:hypothetical protein KUCAC02_013134 [Chaenocephalus aceratus]|uniref:Uncharacterized protein n=1 Tax=Chaenocephalus aceratus TaxID=36190 RepID=A0ACB9XEL5_CHAAC|nr:hypothetical protein KUCAC02_013134 [Chaenocephalus aceratus]